MNKNVIKHLNALKIFQLAYYWPACGNSIFLTIGEKVLLIAGLIPVIFISSYPTGDL